jgi:glycine/D-amino acid oxidase-like deaminating enzyme
VEDKGYDVVIIGGGIIGLSISYFLLREKKRVLLIEKNEIGWGASGACDEMILLQSKKPGILLEMALESLEMYKHFSSSMEMDLGFDNRGGMIFIENERQLKVMEDFVKAQRGYGLDVRIIDKKEVYQRQPHAKKGIIASTYSKVDSQVYPFKVIRAFLREALGMGLDIKRGDIAEIQERKDYWSVLFKNDSAINAQHIVNAGGAWAPDIGKLSGISIPISPKRGQILITEQIPPIGETNAWSAEYIAAKLDPSLMENIDPRYRELGVGFAFSQAPSGNCLIGSTRENVGYCKETTHEALKIIKEQATKYFPILSKVHIIRAIAGLRPTTPDGKPIMGESMNKRGYFIAAGHEGDGIALAPITGKVMADLILGNRISYKIEELSPKRFDI